VAQASSRIRARIGLIIPSSNRLTEPQFHQHAPAGVQVHVTRLRMTGVHKVATNELLPKVAEAAAALADAQCDAIVFHCTANSMDSGVAAERSIRDTMWEATGRPSVTTGSALTEALGALEAKKLVSISPYAPAVSRRESDYLADEGFEVVRERSLDLPGSDAYIAVPPEEWERIAKEEEDPSADAYLFSCTNIHSIDIIERLEERLDRPVVTSNQATLWTCLRQCGQNDVLPGLGRLFSLQAPAAASV
jgi:maleate cis-trans isomerase